MEIVQKVKWSNLTHEFVSLDKVNIDQINGLAIPSCREINLIINGSDGEVRIAMDTNEATALIQLLGNCIDATWSPWAMNDKLFKVA